MQRPFQSPILLKDIKIRLTKILLIRLLADLLDCFSLPGSWKWLKEIFFEVFIQFNHSDDDKYYNKKMTK